MSRAWCRFRRHIGALGGVATAVLAMQVLVAAPASADISFVGKLHTGAHGGALHSPWGVTTDDHGNVYVADTNGYRIVKYDTDGAPVVAFGTGSPETAGTAGHLYYPEGVVWANGHIYVADWGGKDVQVFSTGGAYITKWGVQGDAEGDFNAPDQITADCAGNIYVTDGLNNNVQEFDGNGTFIKRFGLGHLTGTPSGVAVDYNSGSVCLDTDIYVSDEYFGRIAHFAGNGDFIGFIGTQGHGHLQFDHPDQLAVERTQGTSEVDLWVAESGTSRVQHLTSTDGGGSWSYAGEITHGEDPLAAPHGVTIDQQGHLFVSNTNLSEVYEYRNVAPSLSFASTTGGRETIKNTEGLFFDLKYNQLGKSCHVLVKATVTVPPNKAHVFTVEKDKKVGDQHVNVKLDLSTKQMKWLRAAWKAGHKVPVAAKAAGTCSNNVHVTKKQSFKI